MDNKQKIAMHQFFMAFFIFYTKKLYKNEFKMTIYGLPNMSSDKKGLRCMKILSFE